jgi:hypothetical protein
MELIDTLFRQGLGELPVFYSRVSGVYLGNMVYEKGKIYFKDKGLLAGLENITEQPDWDKHLVGMVCYRKLLQWDSLSFYGIDYCEINSGPNPEFIDSLKSMRNEYGDRLFDFLGSIYRAYHLMLDSGMTPVVLLRPINSKDNSTGLAIGDLKSTVLGDCVNDDINLDIRHAVERQLTLNLEDITNNEVT